MFKKIDIKLKNKFNIIFDKIDNDIESVVSIISRIINAATFYLLTFFASKYLVSEDFAKWTLFITFLNLLPLLNLGINTGLVNKISFNNSLSLIKNTENINIINASFKFQIIISMVLVLTLYILFYLKINNSLIRLISTNFFSIIILIASLPFSFYSSILYSFKQINLSNYISIIQNIILLIVSILVFLTTKNLNTFILYYSATYTILFILFFLFTIVKNNIKINFTLKDIKNISLVTTASFTFWIMSFISNILSTAQIFFVTFLFGLNSVPNFFLFQKIYSIINTFHLAYLSPFTVKFIEYASNNKWDLLLNEINSLINNFTLKLYLSFGLVIFLLHPFILNIWTGKNIIDYVTSLIFLVISFLTSICNVYSVLLNSLGHFKVQIIYAFISFISFISFIFILKIYFGPISIAISTLPAIIFTLFLMRQYTYRLIHNKSIYI